MTNRKWELGKTCQYFTNFLVFMQAKLLLSVGEDDKVAVVERIDKNKIAPSKRYFRGGYFLFNYIEILLK